MKSFLVRQGPIIETFKRGLFIASLFGRYKLIYDFVHNMNCKGLVDDNNIVPTTVCACCCWKKKKKANLRQCTRRWLGLYRQAK